MRVILPILLSLVMIFPASLMAQKNLMKQHNDLSRFRIGFSMGLNYNSYNLKEQIQIEDRGVLLEQINTQPRWGLNLAMVNHFKLNRRFAIRVLPGISLEERDFNFYFQDSSAIKRKIEAAYFNTPVLLEMRSEYYKRGQLYVLCGPQFAANLSPTKKVRDNPDLLKISSTDVGLVFAIGWRMFGDRVKLSPEIRYFMGLRNVYEPLYASHSGAINRLSSQVLSLVVNFE